MIVAIVLNKPLEVQLHRFQTTGFFFFVFFFRQLQSSEKLKCRRETMIIISPSLERYYGWFTFARIVCLRRHQWKVSSAEEICFTVCLFVCFKSVFWYRFTSLLQIFCLLFIKVAKVLCGFSFFLFFFYSFYLFIFLFPP